jgi:hypothetical protein
MTVGTHCATTAFVVGDTAHAVFANCLAAKIVPPHCPLFLCAAIPIRFGSPILVALRRRSAFRIMKVRSAAVRSAQCPWP